MKIECTVEELKGLLNIKTPVAGTTDVITLDNKKIILSLEEAQNYLRASYGKHSNNQ